MPEPPPRSDSRQVQTILLGLFGFLVGFLTLRLATGGSLASRSFAQTPRYWVWTLVVGAGTAYAGFIALPLWDWHASLRRRSAYGSQQRAVAVALCWSASITATLFLSNLAAPDSIRTPLDYFQIRMALLLLVILVVTFPAVLSFRLVKEIADEAGAGGLVPGQPLMPIADYLGLQSMLRGLLASVGGLATVAIVEQGAGANAVQDLPGRQDGPREIIFVFASLLAAGVAVLYLPAFSALQRAGRHLVDSLVPLPGVGDEGFLDACDKRDRLSSMLGLDASAKANLESFSS